jgi:hypothetical protein
VKLGTAQAWQGCEVKVERAANHDGHLDKIDCWLDLDSIISWLNE